MASDMFSRATQTTIYPVEGSWVPCPKQQHNMEKLWEEVSAAALQARFIKGVQLREFQQVPRKKFGVKAKKFVGNINGRWTEDGVWLVAYPLLTADGKTWIARLDVFYFFPRAGSAHEYVKNPVLTIQHLVEDRNIWDHISLAYERDSKRLRLTPGEDLDELDLARHTSIDVQRYKHRDIFPRALTAKERDAADRNGNWSDMRPSNPRDTPEDSESEESKLEFFGTPRTRSVESQERKRLIILEDSEDEKDTSAVPGPIDPSPSGSRAGSATNPGVAQAGNEGSGQQGGSSEREKALQQIKALQAMVREQAKENTELKLRLAGSGQ